MSSSNWNSWERGAAVAKLWRRAKGRRTERIFILAFPDIFEHAKATPIEHKSKL
jgi:hypothetical protein